MDWITGIQRALDYVEANILQPIDYEEVAKQAYSSNFHFQRILVLCADLPWESTYECADFLWQETNLHLVI